MAKKELITKDELNKVTDKWLDETELTQNPLDIFNDRNDGTEFDPEASARDWAQRLPDKERLDYPNVRGEV